MSSSIRRLGVRLRWIFLLAPLLAHAADPQSFRRVRFAEAGLATSTSLPKKLPHNMPAVAAKEAANAQ